MVFKKCRENPEDVLFIDASNDFDKIKTQNILREEHIDKIISTYRNRTETPKYSKRAFIRKDAQIGRLNTIESNDYNLNIPRYVDTFEAETSIDIEKLAGELVGLETQMKDTDKAIAGFCKELNIPTPF